MIKVSVIIPVYNEEKTLLNVLQRVDEVTMEDFELEVIVVNDGSKDRSKEIIDANPNLYSKAIHLEKNGGKGAAVQAALRQATGKYVLFQDADLEYHPKDFPKLLAPIKEFGAQVVIGSRFLASQYTRVAYFWHKVGNRLITFLFNVVNNTTFTDIYSCYLVYERKLVDPDELKTFGWQQHAEILSLAVSRGRVFYEVAIPYHGRTYEEGKKIRAIHTVSVIQTIFYRGLINRPEALSDIRTAET